jgi:exopolyphosphatase/guanosine-5'-triphosphate,3'-diphosphate pyrophosphatase
MVFIAFDGEKEHTFKGMRTLASIDAGSNTVKLLVAQVGDDGSLEVLAREKEMVRLGQDTFATGKLSDEAIEAGAEAIQRLARAARSMGAETVRAVATCAVREAENADAFLAEVRRRSEVDVEVVSGEEEARLITLAVRSEFPASCDPLLTVDIGGGSTELVISQGARVLFAESIPIGAVRLSERFVRHDPVRDSDWKALKQAIRRACGAISRKAGRVGFKTCVGTSGTIQSMAMVYEAAVRGREPFPSGQRTLPRPGLKKVLRLLRRTTMKEKLKVPGLDPKRRDIALAGGALLYRILKEAGAEEILTGERGLREGILLDSVSRGRREGSSASRDVREKSVERLAARCNVEALHAKRVARLADRIFESTHALHQMSETEREWLRFSALLHDVGAYIGYKRHNRHSYYLITHGDLTGFSAEEIATIAAVARYHRGGRPKPRHPEWEALDAWRRHSVEKLAAILRVADGLDRLHRQVVEDVVCRVRRKKVVFEVEAIEDAEAEIEAAEVKADLFGRVFGRRAVFRAAAATGAVQRGAA